MEKQHLYEFGDFVLNLKEKTLTSNGINISITPKVFLLLKVLVENNGLIVEKDELMKQVWEDSFVEDSNLTYSIRQLRKILNDDFNQPNFIETIPRRGYRFIGEVIELLPETQNLTPTVTPNKNRFRLSLALFLAVISLPITFWLIAKAYNRNTLPSPILEKPYQSETLAFTGNSPHAALSPNGKYVVYVYGKNDKESIWVKNIETGNNVEIISPTSDRYFGLVFSRDNEQIYLSRKSNFEEPLNVFKVSILGGRLTKILDDVQGWIGVSPDDRQISFVRYTKKDGENCALWVADANGKNPRKLVSRSDGIDIGDNEWSPDGKRIIFANGHAHNASQFYGVSEVEVETGKERTIFQNKFFVIRSLQFLRDNESFLMSGIENIDEPTRIWQVSTTTGKITQITKTNESYQSISLSQNQDKMVAVTIKSDFKLYSHETQNPNNLQSLTEAETFNVSAANKIYFSSKIGGNQEIWSMNFDGSQQKQLTSEKGRDFVPIVSHNGQYVFFTSSRSGVDHLWRMNADGTNQLQITQTEGGYPISADEKFVYYRAISKKKLWKVPIDGGEESLVLDKRSQYFAITKDHSKVAYLEKKDGLKYLIVHSLIDGNEVNSVQIERLQTTYLVNWIQDDTALALIFRDDKTEDFNFQKIEFKASEPNKLINLGQKGVFHNAGFWLSPEGNNLMLIRGEYKTDVIFLQGLN